MMDTCFTTVLFLSFCMCFFFFSGTCFLEFCSTVRDTDVASPLLSGFVQQCFSAKRNYITDHYSLVSTLKLVGGKHIEMLKMYRKECMQVFQFKICSFWESILSYSFFRETMCFCRHIHFLSGWSLEKQHIVVSYTVALNQRSDLVFKFKFR